MSVVMSPDWVAKYVNVVYSEDGTQLSVDGKVLMINASAIYLREKGKAPVLIDADDIETITEMEAPTRLVRIKVRHMAPVAEDQVRQHLADRHGMVLTDIPTSSKNAMLMHSGINHEGLGHQHRADADTVAVRAGIIDQTDDDCEHGGIECELPCACTCNDCAPGGDLEDDDTEED